MPGSASPFAVHAPHVTPGELIGSKYRVVRLLGAGGMGIVVEAEHELTGKRVAIKRLRPQLAERPEHARRMLREAQASARVAHENVVDVYDVGADGDTLYLVMEYLEGETLGALLARGPLSPRAALALLLPAMRGVAHAHDLGIVHRDIKPENIFLACTAGGGSVPKVLDFGISKLPPDGESPTLTASGTTLGTPLYMAHEQLTGVRDVDARADVYAFGVILYEALTGELPFNAETVGSLAVQQATRAPRRASELNSSLPAELDPVLERALARDRSQRYPSLKGLMSALAPFEHSHDEGLARASMRRARAVAATLPLATAHTPSTVKRWQVGLALVLLVALGALFVLRSGPGQTPRADRAPPRFPTSSDTAALPPASPPAPAAALPEPVAAPTPETAAAPSPRPVRERPASRPPRRAAASQEPASAPATPVTPAAAPASGQLRAGRPTLDQF